MLKTTLILALFLTGICLKDYLATMVIAVESYVRWREYIDI